MKQTIRKGYIPSKIEPDHYVLGSSPLPLKVVLPSGNWKDWKPTKEPQITTFDTYNCTGFNTLNALETLEYFLTGKQPNYSDRWLGIIAGTRPPGNDPHTVAEAIRKHGLIPEEMLPFSDDITSVEEYYSFKGADETACKKAGQEWLAKWEFGHEWVLGDRKAGWQARMEQALTASPLDGAVWAWEEEKGLYVRNGNTDTHWTEITNAVGGIQWDVFDSYPPYEKSLAWDFGFTAVKRFHLKLKDPQEIKKVKISIMKKLLDLMNQLLVLLKQKTYGIFRRN